MSSAEITTESRTSRWEDYIDVFFSPAELYARRAADSVKPAMLTLMLLGAIIYYAFLPVNRMIMEAGMVSAAAQRGVDPSQVAATAGGMVKIMSFAGGIMVAITFFVMIVIAAALLWIVGRLVEVKATYHQALVVATYAGFVLLVSQLASSVMAMIIGQGLDPMKDLAFGLARFFDADALPRTLMPLVRRIEIFSIWQAVLWAVGVKVVMNASKAQAAIAAAGAWLLFAVPGVIGAVLGIGQAAAK